MTGVSVKRALELCVGLAGSLSDDNQHSIFHPGVWQSHFFDKPGTNEEWLEEQLAASETS